MRTLRGRLRLSESRTSALSSQIFCRAPKLPSVTAGLSESSSWHSLGNRSGQLWSSPCNQNVIKIISLVP